jgi:hypothetical protein
MIGRVARAGLALACAGLAAGCGSRAAPAAVPAAPAVAAPLATSLATAQGTWAVMVMGGPAAPEDDFWQLFGRPAGAARWALATPEGVADNGGLVAAAGGTSLVAGFRPSQNLRFSPLALSTDAGKSWTPGLLDARLADSPDAIAVAASGRLLALLADGSIQAAPTAGAAAAGQWSPLTTLSALAASAPGRECGLAGVQAVSFGPDDTPIAAGSCVRRGVAGVFAEVDGAWRADGPVLPGRFGGERVQVLGLTGTAGGNAALLLAGSSLLAAWSDGTRWTVSAPAPAGDTAGGTVRAAGFGAGGSAWALLGGGRAETISGAGGSWRALPPVPAGTQVLVPGGTAALGPGGSYDALAVSGARLTVWRLGTAWTKAQQVSVPIAYGSSG